MYCAIVAPLNGLPLRSSGEPSWGLTNLPVNVMNKLFCLIRTQWQLRTGGEQVFLLSHALPKKCRIRTCKSVHFLLPLFLPGMFGEGMKEKKALTGFHHKCRCTWILKELFRSHLSPASAVEKESMHVCHVALFRTCFQLILYMAILLVKKTITLL